MQNLISTISFMIGILYLLLVVHTGYLHLQNALRNSNIYCLGSALICHLVSAQGVILWTCDSFICNTWVGKQNCWSHYDSLVCHLVILEHHIIMQLSMFFSHDSQLKTLFIWNMISAVQMVSFLSKIFCISFSYFVFH